MRRDPGNEVDITCHIDDAGVLPYEYRLPPPQKPKGIFFLGYGRILSQVRGLRGLFTPLSGFSPIVSSGRKTTAITKY